MALRDYVVLEVRKLKEPVADSPGGEGKIDALVELATVQAHSRESAVKQVHESLHLDGKSEATYHAVATEMFHPALRIKLVKTVKVSLEAVPRGKAGKTKAAEVAPAAEDEPGPAGPEADLDLEDAVG